ncbi:MAG: hypothetical protein LBO05_04625 [Deltaproteobacteria bacterium]|jgi:hypothetical protein|nr:hypothetical protein [Deltaproteobacteria bacterium]
MPPLLVIGAVLFLGGLALLVTWFEYVWMVLKVFLTFGLLGAGGLLAYFGWEERKDRQNAFLDFSSPAEASRYQSEARAYQEKLNQLQEGREPGEDAKLAQDPGAEAGPAGVAADATRVQAPEAGAGTGTQESGTDAETAEETKTV